MKKVASLITFFCIAGFLLAQEQRLVLLEEFTQASCGPCASVNPSIKALLNSNPDKITSVWYHTSWPGYDPMNLHNPHDVTARVSYYSVGYVPYSVLDGNYYTGSATGWNINTVNARYAMPSPFKLQLRHVISSGNDSVYLTLVAKASQTVSGVLVAHSVVIEKNIHFTNPPGSNGETDFKNVMKKMLPNSGGATMPTSFEPGDYVIFENVWKFANVYNTNEIAAVGFVQNNGNKEIHQSCNSTTGAITLPYNIDLQVMEVTGLPYSTCVGKITPIVMIRNNGNNTVTSFRVQYKVNNGDLQEYNWSGSIQSLQKAVITLPEYSFIPEGTNQLKVFSDSPNSSTDEYPKNDTLLTPLKTGPLSTNTVFFYLKTDNNPEETTWELKNSLGQVVQSGGPYSLPLHMYKDTLSLPLPDCYVFTIYDAGGDGICCANGTGGYELSDNEGTAIRKNGGIFGFSETTEWRLPPPSLITDPTLEPELSVAPNPFNNQTTVTFTLIRPEPVTLSLFDAFGRNIKMHSPGTMTSGTHEVVFESGNVNPGLYVLQLRAGANAWTVKVFVTR